MTMREPTKASSMKEVKTVGEVDSGQNVQQRRRLAAA